jgi:SPP1 gp7 family putative phage head morphogenesis protein
MAKRAIQVRRAIARLAGERLRRRKIPRQKLPAGARLQYQKLLTGMRRTFEELLRSEVIAVLPAFLRQADLDRAGLRGDAVTDDILRVFSNFQVLFANAHPVEKTEQELSTIAANVNTNSRAQHQRQMKAALGVEVIVPEPFQQAAIDGFVRENLNLVQSLQGAQFDRMRAIVSRGIQGGLRVESIRDQLIAQLGIDKSKASLLARDQTLRLHGELTELRQRNVGIEEYDWDTSGDERVRPRHAELQGTRQSWADPPVVQYATAKRPERRAHPGGDYQCRCQAIPVIPESLLTDE